jgi:hypothetical protein
MVLRRTKARGPRCDRGSAVDPGSQSGDRRGGAAGGAGEQAPRRQPNGGLGFRGFVRKGAIENRGCGKPEEEARAEIRQRAAAPETAGSNRRGSGGNRA